MLHNLITWFYITQIQSDLSAMAHFILEGHSQPLQSYQIIHSNHQYQRKIINQANPIRPKIRIQPKSINPLLPLPSFQYDHTLVELAPNLNLNKTSNNTFQTERFLFQENQLSKLFEHYLYKSSERLTTKNNSNFACMKANYSESCFHPQRKQAIINLPNENQSNKNQQKQTNNESQKCRQLQAQTLQFQSRFESGNLAFATISKTNPKQYHLLMSRDINTSKCTQWFFFRVKNKAIKQKITFNLVNFIKNYSIFENGMKIAICQQSKQYKWTRDGSDIKYRKTNIEYASNKYYYSLSFTFEFEQENDTTYFAYCFPYTFSMLDEHLLKIQLDPKNKSILKRKCLAESAGGNYVDMLIITNFKLNQFQQQSKPYHQQSKSYQEHKSLKQNSSKQVVFITARVHPGETPSSFVCEGIINFLLTDEAAPLRDQFIFKIVPMLNPDGVINGNYRCSLSGYDLNRVWHSNNKISSPEIYFTKRAVLEDGKCFLFMDLHAHSKKKGIFMYGCQNRSSPFLSRQVPYLLWKNMENFNYYQCNFAMMIGRQGTSRITINRQANVLLSYTMEHSFCSPVKSKYHFTVEQYQRVGIQFCQMLQKYYCRNHLINLEDELKQLYSDKQLIKVGQNDDCSSSDDEELDAPRSFDIQPQVILLRRRKKQVNSTTVRQIPNQSITRSITRNNSFKKQSLSPNRRYETANKFHSIEKIRQKAIQSDPIKISLVGYDCQFQENQKKMRNIDLLSQTHQIIVHSQAQEEDVSIQKSTFKFTHSNSRYQFEELDGLNNLFLPSITSASYKRYAKKKDYHKNIVHVGKKFLDSNGFLKKQIKSVSRRKNDNWEEKASSYL